MGLKKVVYTAGTFDILNLGHVNIFKKSKKLGNYLIVGVSTDKLVESYKHIKPIMPYKERFALVGAIKYVDKVIKQTKLLDINILKKIRPDIITIGSDWQNKILEGLVWAKENNIKIIYLPYTQQTSSSEIKKRIIKRSYEIIQSQCNRSKNVA